ncbi:NAD-specific glutamate dehydrogenase, large form [hydrothermal vent metagenome]|uniref:NAD-specific glutamate dehydrogenase, large form n=1 Tax=hydrothermal vent metagenome TaxID=652676 RepID=A0A3B0TD17_9ZZZZ
MTSWTQKKVRIDAVTDFAADRMKSAHSADFTQFIQDLYKYASPEELANRPIDELYAAALSLWKYCDQRDAGCSKIRVFNPTLEEHGWPANHTIIQIVNDDMPFLLDSITSNLLEDGNDLHMLVHPIITNYRDKNGKIIPGGSKTRGAVKVTESIMHIEITAMTDPEQIAALHAKLNKVVGFIRATIEDWKPMLAKMDDVSKNLASLPKSAVDPEQTREAIKFLKWLKNNNFTILGYREYFHDKKGGKKAPHKTRGDGYGILRDPSVYILKGPEGLVPTSPEIEYFMEQPQVMLITKANIKSLVHRVVHMDYIGFKKYDKKGNVISEIRFAGLFTAQSYQQRAETVPYLDRKVHHVVAESGFAAESHDGRALMHILETLPRDELFQIEEEQLLETAMGILHLKVMPRCQAFIRKDRFERYISALVFVPRDMYDSTLRGKVERILCDAFNGELSSHYAQLSNERIARWHFIIRTTPGNVPNPDSATINKRLAEVAQRWNDHLQEVLNDRWGEEVGTTLFRKYNKSFSTSYREHFDPRFAVTDIEKLEQLPESCNIQFNFYRLAEDPDHAIRLKIYTSRQTIALSDCLPMLENLGLRVIEEYAFSVYTEESGENITHAIHDFYMEDQTQSSFDLSVMKERLENTLRVVWVERVDNDGFNKLVLRAGMNYRQALILRIYSKYLRQLSLSYSEIYMQDTLTQYWETARDLVSLFEVNFSPVLPTDLDRDEEGARLEKNIRKQLEKVDSLDQDRMLRSYLNVITSSLRTNFYQPEDNGTNKPYVSIKIQSRNVREAPKPRPYAEIFVYSPRIEGVHLRSGPVARGGLRWSDRREDYRTEVLGLVKAQQVKNTVIVPVGAKGGFVPKKMPVGADREGIMAEGIACYKTFISGLLDITDNLKDNEVVYPANVIRRDDDDPYLVVAADKGTATFSDIANGLARDYGFWLDDAFASGGSNGYDHKKMGITAKGAWVSVQRHFREKDINVQTDSITIVGIGDMSGDVFGNGLLCSEAVKLVAAFDHRDIFIDPDPDPATSFRERQRLFDLPRSSWQDYNSKLISRGGGIFSRRAKSIPLSTEIKQLLGFEDDQDSATPNEVMKAILTSHADLLWFGGIGTYIKSSRESHSEVGDRANDAIRINGKELNCTVVAEGGNLACTQRGRIEYCLTGGLINTDAVDNSAGVDCSDNEVNIKILLNALVQDGKLTPKQRDLLLVEMTDEVSKIVLNDNYLQTQAISLARSSSIRELDSFVRFMADLEKSAQLDRELEFLPSDDELIERTEEELGLTRPEIAVLIAYSKMGLYDELMASDILDDPYLDKYLIRAFPAQLREKYASDICKHQLKSGIIAKEVCNEIVNRGGIQAIKEETGAMAADIARASILASEVFGLAELYEKIENLDYVAPATIQILMLMDVEAFARRQTIWFLNNTDSSRSIQDVIDQFKPGVQKLFDHPANGQDQYDDSLKGKVAMYCEQNVDEDLAVHIASLEMKMAACDIVLVAHDMKIDVTDVARAYFMLGDEIGFDWLRAEAELVESSDHWDRLAINSVVADLLDQQKNLTRSALTDLENGDTIEAAKTWLKKVENSTARIQKLIHDFQTAGRINVTKLGFAARQIRNVIID